MLSGRARRGAAANPQPRLLLDLSEVGSDLSAEQRRLVVGLDPLNVEARYPESRERPQRLLDHQKCAELLAEAQELQRWIKQRL